MAGFGNHRNHWGPPAFFDSLQNLSGGLPLALARSSSYQNRGHFDVQIDAVEQRALTYGFHLTKLNTPGTIEMPASLRSDRVRVHPGCRSDSLWNMRSASPESPASASLQAKRDDTAGPDFLNRAAPTLRHPSPEVNAAGGPAKAPPPLRK
jgi:hypothetical protein